MTDLFQIFHAGVDITILVVISKLVRHISKLEIKVEMMWASFEKDMGIKLKED